MTRLRQNPFLAVFLGALGFAIAFSLSLVLCEKRAADGASARLQTTVIELSRLRRANPFPDEENLRKEKAQAQSYQIALLALEDELKERMGPILPLQPNEFQAQLRLAVNAIQESAARANVQLPAGFNLGFEEYASSLPNGEAAAPLGRQLRAIERVTNIMIKAHVDSLGSLTRTPLPEEKTTASMAGSRSGLASKSRLQEVVNSSSLDVSFSASPVAARQIINRIAECKEQVYVVRTLRVRNQVGAGPKRKGPETIAAAPASIPQKAVSASSTLVPKEARDDRMTFIVGTEHLDLATRIEIVNFSLERKAR